jgi:hypothetical protein
VSDAIEFSDGGVYASKRLARVVLYINQLLELVDGAPAHSGNNMSAQPT